MTSNRDFPLSIPPGVQLGRKTAMRQMLAAHRRQLQAPRGDWLPAAQWCCAAGFVACIVGIVALAVY